MTENCILKELISIYKIEQEVKRAHIKPIAMSYMQLSNVPVSAISGKTKSSGFNISTPIPIPKFCPPIETPFPLFSSSFARRIFPSTSPSFGAICNVAILISAMRELEKFLEYNS